MTAPLIITVNGKSTIRKKADRAVMFISITSEDDSQSKVAEDVRKGISEVVQLCRNQREPTNPDQAEETGTAAADSGLGFSTGSFSTGSFQPWSQDGEKQLARRYSASSSIEIFFSDFSRLEFMATRLSQMEFVGISSIEWQLTEETRARLASKSRKHAVEDAFIKASDYAVAAGKSRMTPVEINDGVSDASTDPASLHFARTARRGTGETAEELSLTPEFVNVETSITVKFNVD